MLLDAVKKMMDLVEIQDSRDPKKVRYPLGPTLFAIILAWMCGYNSALQVFDMPCRTAQHECTRIDLRVVSDLSLRFLGSMVPGRRVT